MNDKKALIAEHILIGNCRTAALVSKYGSITWCCIPEFHSPGIFSTLLDGANGGYFTIQPVAEFQSSQTYLPDTNVAELTFENKEGKAKLTDCFVAMEEEDKQAELFPDHEILRIVEGISGTVKFRFDYMPRSYFGKNAVELKDYKKLGIYFNYNENICIFQTSLQNVTLSDDKEKAFGEFELKEGERVIFSLSVSSQYPAIISEIKTGALKRLENTVKYWHNWIGHCKYEGLYKDKVLRSALALKLLVHAPSGAIIAAPTTSLPEWPGGVRNWDYRFCWLRDASFMVRALLELGYHEEAHAYMSWILHATRLTQPKLQVAYTIFGSSRLRERTCDWLGGYKGSRPVRIGNAAHNQFQLDIYGEVLDAVYMYADIIEGFDNGTKRFILGLGKTICKYWSQPDNGIWEARAVPEQHTHSKVMMWIGLDRLVKLCKKYNWDHGYKEKFEQTKKMIQDSVEQHGFSKELNSYVKSYGVAHVDAALLVFSLTGYCDANSPEMTGTVQQIRKQLTEHHFVYRYHNDDGLPGREGAFIVANFWLIENLAKMGNTEEAMELFERTTEHVPAHGLISEEIDPVSKEWLGNYPQGFSHIGLINAAITITKALEKQKA